MNIGNVKKRGLKRVAPGVLFLLFSVGSWAQDFSLTVPGGQTLYFNILAPGNVEVTYPNHTGYPVSGWVGYTQPTGFMTIPATVTYDDVQYTVSAVGAHAFYGCTGLTQVTIESGITSLGASAFCYCSGLTAVTLAATVTALGSQTFGNCASLAEMSCYAAQPPTATAASFYNTTLSSCMLHVPAAGLAAYSATAPWSSFGTIDGLLGTVSVTLAVNDPQRGTVTGGGTFMAGSSVSISALPAEGCAFICWNDGNCDNPRLLTLTADVDLTAMFFPLLHDTIQVHDTLVLHDTVIEYDTVGGALRMLRVFSSHSTLGIGVGSCDVPAGTDVEICALPLGEGRFAGWNDGVTDNPRRVTVTRDISYTAFFEQLSIVSPDAAGWKVGTEGREVVVAGAKGLRVAVYDAAGRLVTASDRVGESLRLTLPAAGVYVVRVGETGAAKVTVE